jgi:hypothetical protein
VASALGNPEHNDCDHFIDEGCPDCTPDVEACNGIDDDCDGGIDEGCGCEPIREICDGFDNDCDSLVDETCVKQPLLACIVGFLGVALACTAGDSSEESAPTAEVPAIPTPAETAKVASDAPPVASDQDIPPAEGAGALAGEVPCNVGAIVNDPDPKGLNVRASPEGEVLGQVPMDTQVHLAAARDGWVRIDHAWNAEDDGRTWPLGWVHPSLLRTHLKHPADYGPDRSAKLSSSPNGMGTPIRVDPLPSVEVRECQDRWLKVELEWPDGDKRTGWLASESHCPSTVTTCP